MRQRPREVRGPMVSSAIWETRFAYPGYELSPQIADADPDHDEAGEDQRYRKPRLALCSKRGLRVGARGGAAEGRDVVGDRLALAPLHVGRSSDAAHLGIIGLVERDDGGFGGVRLGHFAQKLLVARQEILRLRRQRRSAVELGHHLPGGKVRAGPRIGTSRNQHIRSLDQEPLGFFFALSTRRYRLTKE